MPGGRKTPLVPTDLPTLASAQNPDQLCAAVIRYVWYQAFEAGELDSAVCPSERILTWDRFVRDWLHNVSPEAMATVNRSLEPVLGRDARWLPWPSGDKPPVDVRATHPLTIEIRGSSGAFAIPLLSVMEVHQRWLSLPKPYPEHPLVAVIKARPLTPFETYVSHIHGMIRMPYTGTEALRRSWQGVGDVNTIKVDGEPVVARLQGLAPTIFRLYVYVDNPKIVDSECNIHPPSQPFMRNIYPQDARRMPLPMVALHMLGDRDGRDSLRRDMWMLLTVVYASIGAVVWTEEEGARLLARNSDGGFRRPTKHDVRRWRRLMEYASSIEIWYSDEHGSRFEKAVFVYPLNDGRVSIDRPIWYHERRFTLTAAVHRARHIGENRNYPLVIGSMEYWLARSYEGEHGVAPMLRPEQSGGHGPWAPSSSGDSYWTWYEVLQCLALERFDMNSPKARNAALRRYWRLVDGFSDAGYMRHGDAGPGDVVEVEASVRKKGTTPLLRFRASARFCEAAQLAQNRKWSSSRLLSWIGLEDKPPAADHTARDRQALRVRRKALNLENVTEAIRRHGGNITRAERDLGVGGSEPGSYLRGWIRRKNRAQGLR